MICMLKSGNALVKNLIASQRMLFCISRSGSLHNVLHLYKLYYKTAVFVNLCCRWLVATLSTLKIDQKISTHYNRPCCFTMQVWIFQLLFLLVISCHYATGMCMTDITVVWYTPQLVLQSSYNNI